MVICGLTRSGIRWEECLRRTAGDPELFKALTIFFPDRFQRRREPRTGLEALIDKACGVPEVDPELLAAATATVFAAAYLLVWCRLPLEPGEDTRELDAELERVARLGAPWVFEVVS